MLLSWSTGGAEGRYPGLGPGDCPTVKDTVFSQVAPGCSIQFVSCNNTACTLLQEEDDVSLSSSDSREGLEEYSASGDSDFDVRAQAQRARRPGRRPGAVGRGHQARAEDTGTGRRAHLARRRVPSRRLRDDDRSGGGGREGLRKRRRLRYRAEASDEDMSLSDEEMGSEEGEDFSEVLSYSRPSSSALRHLYLP